MAPIMGEPALPAVFHCAALDISRTDLIDAAGQPTREAVNDIIAFFQHALKP
jgi:hypothetical protein